MIVILLRIIAFVTVHIVKENIFLDEGTGIVNFFINFVELFIVISLIDELLLGVELGEGA